MTDKDIKKLSRTELLEMLIEQTKENEALIAHKEELERQIKALQQELNDRKIAIENAGSIAEASLQLNGVFEAAQAAADEYLQHVREQSALQQDYAERAEAETQEKIQKMMEDALQAEAEMQAKVQRMHDDTQRVEAATQVKVRKMLEDAQAQSELMLSEASKNCEEMTAKAKRESQEYWNQVSSRLTEYMKQRADLHKDPASNDA